MKKTHKVLLTSISIFSLTLLNTGCMSRNANGDYKSAYSYYPYHYYNHSSPQKTLRVRDKESQKQALASNHKTPRNAFEAAFYSKELALEEQKIDEKIPELSQLPSAYAENNINENINKTINIRKVAKANPFRATKAPAFPKLSFSNKRSQGHTIGDNIEQTAKSLLGIDYQYGASGPYQYDCSGFTKFVFSKQGISLPRISRDQAQIGELVEANHLQKGDLIFFDSKSSSAVSHVGIYLGGEYFIHASSAKDKVTISKITSNYYSKHFKWGRRVTKNLHYSRR